MFEDPAPVVEELQGLGAPLLMVKLILMEELGRGSLLKGQELEKVELILGSEPDLLDSRMM